MRLWGAPAAKDIEGDDVVSREEVLDEMFVLLHGCHAAVIEKYRPDKLQNKIIKQREQQGEVRTNSNPSITVLISQHGGALTYLFVVCWQM